MSVSLASLISPKFTWLVFGHPIEGSIGKSDDLVHAVRGAAGAELTLVKVSCVNADGMCFPIPAIIVLPGTGDKPTDEELRCCSETDIKVWHVIPDTPLPFLQIGKSSLSQLIEAKRSKRNVGSLAASLTFGNIQLNGSVLSVQMNVRWSENIAGIDIVLVDQSFPISFDFGVQNPYPIHLADVEGPFGLPISIDANISVSLNPNQVCAELRATFPGGNIQGPHGCQGF
ncbi:hypothetical protein [Paraburkholderia caledonica]|uniref:Uncharacterized protein n=1 Tax=Paraburkholderia caledonica TaxID=134536 RepID=A0ABU1KT98_9BURK|nr:hypothetical protein [Paraburkholderia caledonica]MDR6374173.1 hypothetical protein [Paraburkholderia caledonica]